VQQDLAEGFSDVAIVVDDRMSRGMSRIGSVGSRVCPSAIATSFQIASATARG
jgi:hypothetical protein